MIPAMAMAQEPEAAEAPSQQQPMEYEAPGAGGAGVEPASIMLPYMELADGGTNWDNLEVGKFYHISAPAHWYEPAPQEDGKSADGSNSAGNSEANKGWIMEENRWINEYISINEYTDMLTWLKVEEIMLEEITDSTAARATRRKVTESVHTVDASGEYLDIIGTISGYRQKSRNFQIMQYAGRTVIYDYNNKILRLLDPEPLEKNSIIDEQN